ncbi:MAG: hypothetical protein E6R03_08210 [Hyphomicrobiaceae bacterium]|nr:MAG: hypothetical protein E6R03_08210 [Hyphomicrobiaceae bacterium]
MKFFLGTHVTSWLGRLSIPLFISRRRLTTAKLHKALGSWALDSGGFSELSMYGEWTTEPEEYVDDVRRFSANVGNLEWAAIQDWMCEPQMLAKTGLNIVEHQRRTVLNYNTLLHLAPEIAWTPVLQGWEQADYKAHVTMYEAEGHILRNLPVLGIGSVCRRQHLEEIAIFLEELKADGFNNLHGFGFKTTGLMTLKQFAMSRRNAKTDLALASADSMSWSFTARYEDPLPGCNTHINCANCIKYAMMWYNNLQRNLEA